MGSTWGKNLNITIFGESHGFAIGVTIDGFPAGVELDTVFIDKQMARRRPSSSSFSTKRKEADEAEILSGIKDGHTTGAPITAIIRNSDQHSGDYEEMMRIPRPSHADYTASIRYENFHDVRGGGHFSGRLTAPIVFCGALCRLALRRSQIETVAHIKRIYDVEDKPFDLTDISKDEILRLQNASFPVLDEGAGASMMLIFETAKEKLDSVGGIIECAVTGLPAGLGSPMFEGIENKISSLIFGIPAVKGIEFGTGFGFAGMFGSEANDPFIIENEKIRAKTNNNGGILGGISTGMPVVFRTAIKPTPSIGQTQKSVDMVSHTETELSIKGRHDPCIVPRAVPVIENAAAIAVLDMMLEKNGYSGI
ncbi:MAG: chorismate synthase [Bacillota bacterium]|nr:chorismate synthase [Bacillota bacterium]